MILFRDPDDSDGKVSINVASESKAHKSTIVEETERDIKQLRKQNHILN